MSVKVVRRFFFDRLAMTSDRPSTRDTSTLTLSAKSTKSGARSRARYLRLWEAIRKTRGELSDWQSQVERIMTNFNVQIRPREKNLTQEVQLVTNTLIEHAERTLLDSSQAALLHLWIVDNLESLKHHPFAEKSTTDGLQQRWHRYVYVDKDQQSKNNGGESSQTDAPSKKLDDELDDDDIVFNFSSSYEPPSHQRYGDRKNTDSQQSNDFFGYDEHTDTHEQANGDQGPAEDSSDASDQASSTAERVFADILTVDQLFRPLARALHPDREQDEKRKAENHALMSECLQARENNDVDTLLSLYIEHVGALPKGILADSHDELIRLLERQLKKEQWKLRQARFSSGFERMLLDRYQRDDAAAEQTAFGQHAASLDAEIQRLSTQRALIQNESGLLSALQDRKLIEQDRVSIRHLTGA